MTSATIIRELQTQAHKNNQRRSLVFAGGAKWCRQQADIAIQEMMGQEAVGQENNHIVSLYIGGQVDPGIPVLAANKSKQWLGRELDFLVFDAHCGFDVDAFGAISGTLRAGGLMVLLVPELSQWSDFNDPEHKRIQVYPQTQEQVSGYYLERLAQLIKKTDALSLLTESNEYRRTCWPEATPVESNNYKAFHPNECRTKEQADAVALVHKVARGHRRRPLVLTADRGRGKSAALGIAAGQLLNEGIQKIIVTAPAKSSTDVIFQYALECCDLESEVVDQCLVFIAPDELIRVRPECDLLLVDEAAAIPASLLTELLHQYSRIVFSSTIHGYEGTGRGFAIRFRKVLDAKTPQWRSLHIHQPIRWVDNDPLEAFIFRALLLNAVPTEVQNLPKLSVNDYEFRQLTSEELIGNESLLTELFGLLVLAHYQTRPFDLRHILDGGNIEVSGLFQQGHLVATVLAAREGEIESDLVEPIWLGQRRVRGHLLPQSLSNHVGMADAVILKGLRIIRIAVHPDRQQQGLGSRLLDAVRQQAMNDQYDYLGTSFGATTELLRFWSRSYLIPVRMGMTREASSGTHSVMMLQGLTHKGQTLLNEAQARFRQQFHWLLMEGLEDLEVGIICILLQHIGYTEVYEEGPFEQKDLRSYIDGLRQYDCCMGSIKAYCMRLLVSETLDAPQQQLLVTKVLQNQSWQRVAGMLNLPGRKQVQQLLRETISERVKRSHLS
ncbi:hypothetical protein AB835_12960 [Candidatus Endobugula sertula]|uniref:tRNA(Met) cytidine acetyltransferase TmcA n=1 Tax=Candidatus Endobugula sertula TaxID=62101 RepID=A0A1D2QM67_9GAMM|nr:hypothetical protein AB835_12960 [Candidatus Endobugula sertula]